MLLPASLALATSFRLSPDEALPLSARFQQMTESCCNQKKSIRQNSKEEVGLKFSRGRTGMGRLGGPVG